MNALETSVTMTSLELVEFINSQRNEGESELRHSDFLKKVPQVLGETVAGNFSRYYKASNGKQNPMYRFPKREACLMAMSYSYDLQAKVFDRMSALEARPVDPLKILNDPSAMRGLLLTYSEKVLALQDQVAEQAPQVLAFKRLAGADGGMCFTDAAKTLQMRPKDLIAWLSCNRWIYKRVGNTSWVAYQEKIHSGFMEHKSQDIERPDGTTKTVTQARILPKGMVQLALIAEKAAA